ncbi:hypothetical protein SAMN05216388_102076 [Halorientalis persicus]|uniref:DUF7982 domain-containing protein n=1 Tax=Halorientalis persicus TaxID=1367881 RepID=A0A1H8SWU2_9EURY|nr:hypothetical protein [Halorientalis persicus]SEO83459.1 hypothetical protein SAMN05216388_102076 [Halorientalis persicus]
MGSEHDSKVVDDEDSVRKQSRLSDLESENERLQSRLETRVTYRRAAALLLAFAAVAVGAVQVFPSERDVLFALAGTGTFGAVLLLTLTAEQLLPARAVRSVCETTSRNRAAIAHALGADGPIRYVPTETGVARLYVAATERDSIPPAETLTSTVVDEDGYYGIALEPTGRDLLTEVRQQSGDLPEDVDSALPMLFEAATDLFEFAETVKTINYSEPAESGRTEVTIKVVDNTVGTPTGIDHPIRSLVGVGLTTVVDGPVETRATTDDDGEPLLIFGWGGDQERTDHDSTSDTETGPW